MQIGHVFAAVPVRDLDAACRWYERLFGRPADLLPRADEAVWRLNAGASLYLRVDRDLAGRGALTLAVADLDAHLSVLGSRGMSVSARPAGVGAPRSVAISDEDGNTITFLEDPSAPAEAGGDFHLRVKQRELERDAAEAVSRLNAGFTALADAFRRAGSDGAVALADEVCEHLRSASPPQVQTLRVTLRILPSHFAAASVAPAELDALAEQLDALEIALRRLQNLGRGERWLEG
jgi:catechol 2,3-dioxygenase-like lactoylglutathione lyase family enzyme